MAQTRDASQAADKWKRVTPERADDYQAGVQNPRHAWAASTAAAADRFAAGVTAAIKDERFATGVRKAGDNTWQSMTLNKGPARFTEGVALSGPMYQEAVQPFIDTIKATSLPPRFATGDPRNVDRVKVLASALRQKKVGAR